MVRTADCWLSSAKPFHSYVCYSFAFDTKNTRDVYKFEPIIGRALGDLSALRPWGRGLRRPGDGWIQTGGLGRWVVCAKQCPTQTPVRAHCACSLRALTQPSPHAAHCLHVNSADNAQVVHHMILYRVPQPVKLGQAPWDCSSMPSGASPIWVWAVGCVPAHMRARRYLSRPSYEKACALGCPRTGAAPSTCRPASVCGSAGARASSTRSCRCARAQGTELGRDRTGKGDAG